MPDSLRPLRINGSITMRVPIGWTDRARIVAGAIGMSASQYIRSLVTADCERLERELGITVGDPLLAVPTVVPKSGVRTKVKTSAKAPIKDP
jgi:hypothetical protein